MSNLETSKTMNIMDILVKVTSLGILGYKDIFFEGKPRFYYWMFGLTGSWVNKD